jgi:hypothetical protein
MTQPTILVALLALAGLAWTAGGLLQWLTLRKQEHLIQELERHRALLVVEEEDGVSSYPDIKSRREAASRRRDLYEN